MQIIFQGGAKVSEMKADVSTFNSVGVKINRSQNSSRKIKCCFDTWLLSSILIKIVGLNVVRPNEYCGEMLK